MTSSSSPRVRIILFIIGVLGVIATLTGIWLYDPRFAIILGGVLLILIAIDLLS